VGSTLTDTAPKAAGAPHGRENLLDQILTRLLLVGFVLLGTPGGSVGPSLPHKGREVRRPPHLAEFARVALYCPGDGVGDLHFDPQGSGGAE
jgi:hypothetical protein